jgi:hypothetical protein
MRRAGVSTNHTRHTREGGYPVRRGFSVIIGFSGILDHPLSRVMTRGECSGSVPSINVVPAKAGTHTPWPLAKGCYSKTFAQHNALWLWVPAPRAQLRTRPGRRLNMCDAVVCAFQANIELENSNY